jgi:hypothetical protein
MFGATWGPGSPCPVLILEDVPSHTFAAVSIPRLPTGAGARPFWLGAEVESNGRAVTLCGAPAFANVAGEIRQSPLTGGSYGEAVLREESAWPEARRAYHRGGSS